MRKIFETLVALAIIVVLVGAMLIASNHVQEIAKLKVAATEELEARVASLEDRACACEPAKPCCCSSKPVKPCCCSPVKACACVDRRAEFELLQKKISAMERFLSENFKSRCHGRYR